MIIHGFCHPPFSSEKRDADVELLPQGRLRLLVDEGEQEQALSNVVVSGPLGGLPIKLTFPGGWQFVPNASKELESYLHSHRRKGSLHRVERNLPAIAGSLVAMLLVLVLFFSHGMPWLTGLLVRVMPDQVAELVGEEVLTSLDGHLLAPSELPAAQQAEIRQRFSEMLGRLPSPPVAPNLLFRRWEAGPNALALSDGSIIVFDSLVALAQTPEQLDSILLHEIGHVHHQHVMKALVRSTLLSAAVAVLTGESTGLIDTFSGVGVFLTTQGYSRSDEQEADTYAALQMVRLYGTVAPMLQMFEALHALEEGGALPEWLSTHPELEARIETIAQSATDASVP